MTVQLDLPTQQSAGFFDGIAQCYLPPQHLSIADTLELHSETASELDPITYEVVRYSLLNTNFEHGNLIKRLCVSPVVMIALDFQTSVLLEDGDLVFLGPNLQYFSNSQSFTAKWILENRSENPGIHPGDMFLSSDPFVGAPHQPDVCVSAPVFVDGKLFCWVANVMNHTDVGGNTPGSFCLSATDSWGDPPNIPPIKLVAGGTLQSDVEELFVRQSRMPAMARMDLRAAVSGNEFARDRIITLVKRYGADVVKAVMRRSMDAAENLFAERLRSIPDGSWSHRAYTESDIPGDKGIYRYQVNVHKRGDRLYVDNQGTDPQSGSINCPYVAFVGAVLCALTQQMTSDLGGAYGGVYRRVSFAPVPGTLNCPSHPAAVSPAGAFTTEMNINAASLAIGRMMGCGDETIRDLILGPVVPHAYGVIYAGAYEDGTPFIMINSNGITGAGAGRAHADGIDAGGQYWVPEAITYNVENTEAQQAVLYLYRRIDTSAHAGAGRHRGGPGFVECTVPHHAAGLQVSLYSNESFTKGPGLFGGNPNGRAWLRLIRGTDIRARFAAGEVPQDLDVLGGSEEVTYFKGHPLDVGPDDVFAWSFPTNAGYGDPLLRDPGAVSSDVLDGRLTEEDALAVYGVCVNATGVDGDGTRRTRRSMYAARLGGTVEADPIAPDGARQVGESLAVLTGRFVCHRCGADVGPADGNFKDHAVLRRRPAADIAPEFAGGDPAVADRMEFREFLCGTCGVRFDTEIAAVDDPPLWDLKLVDAGDGVVW
ncbi:hydantoinase B/oxoprolinase family protein [Nocardia sp. R7R-8]|uniref:hydantoinase B/oxoprolinase family protein n=1 Tax=Nocardia sp. R7R-8 TaxID=3459304 RepID=UPI00403E096A